MFRLGMPELVIILIIVFFLFGAKRLPEMGKGIGEGIKNFKKSMKNNDDSEKPTTSLLTRTTSCRRR